jgi:hypothetical protein
MYTGIPLGEQTSQCNRLPGQPSGSIYASTVSLVEERVICETDDDVWDYQSIDLRASQCLRGSAAKLVYNDRNRGSFTRKNVHRASHCRSTEDDECDGESDRLSCFESHVAQWK